MAGDAAASFEFLVAAALRSIDDLRRVVQAVPTEVDGRGTQFLKVVEATLDALTARVEEHRVAFKQASDDQDRESALRRMRRTNRDVLAFHSYTPWIAAIERESLGLGLIYFVKKMVTASLKHSADVVVTPTTDYMYETIYKPFEVPLVQRLGGVYPPGVPPIVVTYPVQEPESLFLHLIIAHELGHSVVYEKRITTAVLNRANKATRDLLDQAAAEFGQIESVPLPVATAEISTISRNWIDEVICDGVALGLLGPSFLLTATAFSAPFGGPKASTTHPPSNLRTKFLLERLKSWGWRPIVDEGIPKNILAWIDARGAEPQEAGAQSHFVTLERAMDALAADIQTELESHLAGDRFLPSEYVDAGGQPALQLRDFLKNHVLPVQLTGGVPTDSRAIILAGWLHALAEVGDVPASLVEIIGDRDFQRFLTKALEMSVVLEQWKEAS